MFSLYTYALLSLLVFASLLNAAHIPGAHWGLHARTLSRRNVTTEVASLLDTVITGEELSFDYIVIGGGTAGLTVAARLSENSSVTVAVIEAGTFYQIDVPVLASTPLGDVAFVGSRPLDSDPLDDWDFVTTPQPGAGGREIHYARGKCLGGSSAKNFMIYQRPTVQSLQMWADDVGDNSYTWDNFLPYFKKSVQFTKPNTSTRVANATAEYNLDAFETNGGPLHVSYPNYAQPFSSYVQGGFSELNISTIEDFNSGSLIGAQYTTTTIDPSGEQRASSEETFLEACAGRSNLKVYQLTMAKKIVFDSNLSATGVEVEAAGVLPLTIKATKEVILSAGAFQSPQLLMVSGIGPQATLDQYGIQVLVDNPNVGQNMWDHVFAGPDYPINVDSVTRVLNLVKYETEQQGALTSNVADFLGWEKLPSDMRQNLSETVQKDLEYFPSDWPELEYVSSPGYIGDFTAPELMQPLQGNYGAILAAIVAPLSRGNVTIASADANVPPVINPNWLTSESDQAVLVAGFKRVRQAFLTSFMQKTVIGEEYYPGADVQSDEEILKQIQDSLMTVWHASCTCKMGKANDTTTVVDPQARVIGVQSLRVVDASAFALLPPGHPQSTIYALAEKIADDIKDSH
ncbi:alcohol oxidase [Gymnopus androsaceus JB14]|uniref:Alcohol oxidase n=1 Tax=Gymnopus androsaceus JB14 TaxID=1447944 RepID=A0A6A4HPP9_9AGAR|nr:alcohol oxidase [Gymnopus androsaceus JB14]